MRLAAYLVVLRCSAWRCSREPRCALTNSIERETGSNSLFESECDELRDGRWRCNVYDASASGTTDRALGILD